MASKSEKSCSQHVVGFGIAAILGLQIVSVLFHGGIIPSRNESETESKHNPESTVDHRTEGTAQEEPSIVRTSFGRSEDGEDIFKYAFKNKNGLQLEVLNLGGIITKLTVPCRHGHQRNVIAGFDQPERYIKHRQPSFIGAIIGRFANRIANGRFSLEGVDYQLKKNNGRHHLHGGPDGWDKKVWEASVDNDHLLLRYTSPDGDEGYPGKVKVTATFRLTDDNEVMINFTARAFKKATPINLTTHPYFNLGGPGNRTIYDHNVTIYADKYVEVDDELIPTGRMPGVEDTLFDLTSPVNIGDRINNVTVGTKRGFDHSFVLRGTTGQRLAAKVHHSHSGRTMEVYTNQPGLQFYTGNFLNVDCGKGCQPYRQHSAFCLEPQNFPDAVNQPSFPDSILYPGSIYQHHLVFKFYTE